MYSLILLALTPLPPELGRPHRSDWVNDFLFDKDTEILVILGTDDAGAVNRVAVRTKKRTVDVPVEQWRDLLREKLKLLRGDLEKPATVCIASDTRIKHASIVHVMDACKQAGFNEVSFAAPANR